MALPEHIEVRLSSEAAGSISITPVVRQTMPLRELLWTVLSATGKDPSRVRESLSRGAVSQGATRFRWDALLVLPEDLDALLGTFPDADPARAFRPDRCLGVRIRFGPRVIELPCRIASKHRLFRRRSFWDTLMELASRPGLGYAGYSYRTRTDDYRLWLSPADAAAVKEAAGLLCHSGLASQLRAAPIESVEYSVPFP